jgi:MYXO-CTERM domain-containing protein
MNKLLAAALIVAAAGSDALAQVSIANALTVEGVDGFTGAGFAATPGAGQLDSDSWRMEGVSDGACAFNDTCTAGDFARGSSDGGVGTGGLYAFAVPSGAPAIGLQPTADDFTPGSLVVRFSNDTGLPIDAASIEYSFWSWNDQSASTTMAVDYSFDDATYVGIGALSAATPTTATGAAWSMLRLRATVTGLDLAAGASLYLRFNTTDAPDSSGSRDEVAIDDITVRLGCGNGIVDGAEACDDWNNESGDGCAADCTLAENGWTCEGTQPSVCTDIDECEMASDDCLPNSSCDNQPGGYDCPCDAGYEGEGQTACTDIDECDLGLDDCGDGAVCDNVDGGFLCSCENGYDFDGDTCVDVDECAEEIAGCDPHAACENFDGGFSCACDEGYEGDGLSCTEIGGGGGDDDGEPPPRDDTSGCGCRAGAPGSLLSSLLLLGLALIPLRRRRRV